MTDLASYANLDLKAPRQRSYIVAAIMVVLGFPGLLIGLHDAYRGAERLRTEVAQSYDRRIALITLRAHASQAETAQRGYLLTRNPALLEPLPPALRGMAAQVAILSRTRDGDGAATHIPRIRGTIEAMFVELPRTIAQARAGDLAAARSSVSSGPARAIMGRLSIEIAAEIARETAVSNDRQARFLARRARLRDLVVVLVGVVAAMVCGVLAVLWTGASKRHAAILAAFETAKGNATFFDSTVGAVLILDPDGRIAVMNAAAVDLLGYYADEKDKRDIATVIDIAPGDGPFHARLGLVDGKLQRTQLTDRAIRDRLGRTIPVDVAMGVLHAPDGDRVVVSLRDISERKRLDAVKDELMSTVSHEIRTPLTSIVGSLGLLRAGAVGEMPKGATRLIDIAENNSRRLIRLIDDMLDIDRIGSGRLRIERAAIDLRDVLDHARIGSEGLARDRGVTLTCVVPDAAVRVSGDADRLLQVVSNLAANAINAAPEGSVVDLCLTVDAAGSALVTVSDRGRGVPLAFRTRIFGRFERAGRDDGVKGTGLGLAISREIVTLHGGRIWFEDRPGGGTCLAFALPLIATAPPRAAGPRILLCTADDALRLSLAAVLDADGWAHDDAMTPGEIGAAIAADAHALILLDLALAPYALDRLRARYGGGGPSARHPILLVSGTARDADDHFVPLDLIDVIETIGGGARLQAALSEALARTGCVNPVLLHLSDDCDAIATVAVAAAALELDMRVTTIAGRDIAPARIAAAAADILVVCRRGLDDSTLPLAFLLDAHGLAIPTIVHGARRDGPTVVPPTLVVAPPGAAADLCATIRRILSMPAQAREAA